MDWSNTIAVLEAYSEEVMTRLQDTLVERGHMATNTLFNTMDWHVEVGDLGPVAYLDHEDYLKYLEGGIEPAGDFKNPGWKAYPFIREWVKQSPKFIGLEEKEIPRVAYLVTRKIKDKGIEPDPMLAGICEEMMERYLPVIDEAVQQDVSEEVDRNLKEMFEW